MVLQGKDQPPKRACVFAFYDKDGVVDRYIPALLSSLRPFCEKLLIVVNGPLSQAGKDAFESLGAQLLQRENGGFDIAGYKAGILQLLSEEALWDEVIFLNQTVFGPIYPLEEMFKKMDARDLDFWGITKHPGFAKDPWGTAGGGAVPAHIQSYFVAVRKKMLYTTAFLQYWKELPIAETYYDAVGGHEVRFTKHFEDLGFQSGVYIDPKELLVYDDYPLMHHPYHMAADCRCPFVKRKVFFAPKEEFLLRTAGEGPRQLLVWLSQNTQYPLEWMLENLLRTESSYQVLLNTAAVSESPGAAPFGSCALVYDNLQAAALGAHFSGQGPLVAAFENESARRLFMQRGRAPIREIGFDFSAVLRQCTKEAQQIAFYTNIPRKLRDSEYPDLATFRQGLAAADSAVVLDSDSVDAIVLPFPSFHEVGASWLYEYEGAKPKLDMLIKQHQLQMQIDDGLLPSFSRCFGITAAGARRLADICGDGCDLQKPEAAFLPCIAALSLGKLCRLAVPQGQSGAYLLAGRYMLDGYSRVFATEAKRVYPTLRFRMQGIKDFFDDRRYEMTLRDAFKGNLSFKQKIWIMLQLFLSPGAFERVRYLLSGGKPPAPHVHEKSDID